MKRVLLEDVVGTFGKLPAGTVYDTAIDPGIDDLAPTIVWNDAYEDHRKAFLHQRSIQGVGGDPSLLERLMVSGALNSANASVLHLYIRANGSDAADGYSAATAVATYPVLWQRMREALLPLGSATGPIVVHVGAGTFDYALPPPSIPFAPGAFVVLYGDGGGESGQDGFTVVASGVAGAATTHRVLELAAAPATDAYAGYTAELTSGPGAGYRRTIRDTVGALATFSVMIENTAGIIPVVPGNTYRILRPAAVLTMPTIGTLSGQATLQSLTALSIDVPIHAVNIALTSPTAKIVITDAQEFSQVFFGVEMSSTLTHFTDGDLCAGVTDIDAAPWTVRAVMEAIGHTHVIGDWFGWGLSQVGTTFNGASIVLRNYTNGSSTYGRFTGVVVGDLLSLGGGEQAFIFGGRAGSLSLANATTMNIMCRSIRTFSNVPNAFLVRGTGSAGSMQSGSLINIPLNIGTENPTDVTLQLESAGAADAFSMTGGSAIIGFSLMSISAPACTGVGLLVRNGSRIAFSSSVMHAISAPLGTAMRVTEGSSVSVRGIDNVTGVRGIEVINSEFRSTDSRVLTITATGGPALLVDGGDFSFDGAASAWTATNAAGSAVRVINGGRFTQRDAAGVLTVTNLGVGAAAHGIEVAAGATAYVRGGANTVVTADGFGIDARFGGRVYCSAQPSSVVGGVGDLIVDTAVGGRPDTDLTASESGIANAVNGSIIARAA